jgi:hypothetical protein
VAGEAEVRVHGAIPHKCYRGRSQLAHALTETAAGPASHRQLEAERREQWEDFCRTLHEQPTPRTYTELFAPEVDVRDRYARWTSF